MGHAEQRRAKALSPTVYIGMTADIVHHGHTNITAEACKLDEVIIGLLTDEAVSGDHQPLLCRHVSCHIGPADPRAVLYRPRSDFRDSVICHLGEAHLGRAAEGRIIEALPASGDEGCPA